MALVSEQVLAILERHAGCAQPRDGRQPPKVDQTSVGPCNQHAGGDERAVRIWNEIG